MAWGTTAKAEIYFDRQTYNDKDEVYARLRDVEEEIRWTEEKIRILIAGNPRELLNTKDCEGNEMDTIDVVMRQTDDLLEWHNTAIIEKFKLELLLESFDTRDGEFIKKSESADPAQQILNFDDPYPYENED